MITIQTISLADCDGGGTAYVVCHDNDVSDMIEQFDTMEEAEKKVAELEA